MLHMMKRTTVGLHVTDLVFQNLQLTPADQCPRCQQPQSPFVSLAVIRTFYEKNPTFASAMYEWFKACAPPRPRVVGRKYPHVMDVI